MQRGFISNPVIVSIQFPEAGVEPKNWRILWRMSFVGEARITVVCLNQGDVYGGTSLETEYWDY